MVKTLHSQGRGPVFDSWGGNQISHDATKYPTECNEDPTCCNLTPSVAKLQKRKKKCNCKLRFIVNIVREKYNVQEHKAWGPHIVSGFGHVFMGNDVGENWDG